MSKKLAMQIVLDAQRRQQVSTFVPLCASQERLQESLLLCSCFIVVSTRFLYLL